MKYAVLVGDGMADEPLQELDGRTPLEAAETPNMDALAQGAELLGRARTIPEGYTPGSDVGNMSILGYDPTVCFTGRAPIEAASQGIALGPDDVAVRCNLVTLAERDGRTILTDHSGGHIPTEQARPLVETLQAGLQDADIEVHPGVGYRHLVIWRGGRSEIEGLSLTPPHDIPGEAVEDFLPGPSEARGAQRLRALMDAGREALASLDHDTAANAIWLWGAGPTPSLTPLRERFGIEGTVVSAVDLVRGLGTLAGLNVADVPGMTAYLDTNYEGKAEAALAALDAGEDLAFVHVEAPDEVSHEGDLGKKLRAIADFDARIVGPVWEGIAERFEAHGLLVLPDHPTSLRTRVHTADPVPFLLYRAPGDEPEPTPTRIEGYHERAAAETGVMIDPAHTLIERLLARTGRGE